MYAIYKFSLLVSISGHFTRILNLGTRKNPEILLTYCFLIDPAKDIKTAAASFRPETDPGAMWMDTNNFPGPYIGISPNELIGMKKVVSVSSN